MKTINFCKIPLIILALLVVSCSDSDKRVLFGETDYFEDFLWEKYEPVIMTRTLTLDFNDDAKRVLKDKKFKFNVFEALSADKKEVAKNIVVYKNNQKCEGNIIEISVDESEVELGIEFTKNASEGEHTLYLGEVDKNGLDDIDYQELGGGFIVEKNDVTNPLLLIVIWTSIIVVSLLIIWYIIAHYVLNPSTKFSRVSIQYPGSSDSKSIRVGGAYKLVCTNKDEKCSFLHKFFVGTIVYEKNDFWTHPFTISSGSGKKIRIGGKINYRIEPAIIMRNQPFSVYNKEDQEVIIQTN